MIIPRSLLLGIRNVSDTTCRENQKTLFMSSSYFPKFIPFKRYVGKYGTAGQAADENITMRMHFTFGLTKTSPQTHMPNT